MIKRDISNFVLDSASWFPVVSVTGPRQSGKSTLVRALFPDYAYVNLEDQSTYERVVASPSDFIRERPDKMIIDEAQRVPELFSAVQVASDERGTAGQYILSGSQNFLLLKRITQSLAGRVGLARLMPLSYREAATAVDGLMPDDFMLRGGYPRLYDVSIPGRIYFENYIATYVERDVSEYIDARNVDSLRKLLILCAQSCGSLLNVSRLASDLGIARATVDSWLSILEASYIIFRLQPYHTNLRKRLAKTPKLYFCDPGLLCHLLGIETAEQLRDSEMRGAIFENLIVSE
ncbi:MAG TPA: ATP-binding protein, partial [Atopobiaceae bacterium]|nr:ATP-binding protein [Atopobiaceae bacterium]